MMHRGPAGTARAQRAENYNSHHAPRPGGHNEGCELTATIPIMHRGTLCAPIGWMRGWRDSRLWAEKRLVSMATRKQMAAAKPEGSRQR